MTDPTQPSSEPAVDSRAPRPGLLFIVSAPSGAGKTSLVRALEQADPGVGRSVSYTTRPPRPGEIDGEHYHFIDRAAFDRMAQQGEFLERARVHGNHYATSERWVRDRLRAGASIVLEIDWQGAAQVRSRMREAIGIFVLPPSLQCLEQRLRLRAQDTPDVIAARLAAARDEISHAIEFDYVIINEVFDEALQDLCAVVRAARLRAALQLASNPQLYRTG